jgi:tetratricopeptide (TPR) repeat protein
LNPEIVQAWNNLANAYLQNGDVDKAIETGEKLVAMAPNFGLGHNNLAVAYLSRQEYEKAREHLDRALSLGFEAHPDLIRKLADDREGGSGA